MRISDWSSDVCSSDLSVNHYDFSGRTARRHCAEILRHLGFRRMTQTDRRALSRWISDDLCAGGQPINAMLEHVFLWCRDRRIYGPSRKELERLVRSQRHLYLEALLARVRARLAPAEIGKAAGERKSTRLNS